MIKNYLLTALRNLTRNRSFSVINILGLVLGLTCSLLIFLWVNDERSTDTFNTHTDRLYSIYERIYTEGKVKGQYNTPGVLADEMKRAFPEVQYACGFLPAETHTFQAGEKILKQKGGFAGADFFKLFSYPVIQGNYATALNTPVDMAISRTMANNLFGSAANALGKTIRYESRKDFRVTAVFDKPSISASQQFEFLINWQAFLEDHAYMKSWGNNGVRTYISLKPNASSASLQKAMIDLMAKYNEYDNNFRVELGMQRFDEMYLYGSFNEQGNPDSGRVEYVRLFSIVAIFILLIACVNFMNLATARSVKRAKEIGVRKVVGAFRSSLIAQFIGEAVLLVLVSMLLALGLIRLLLPLFNTLTQKDIALPFNNIFFWVGITGITLLTGIIAGSYPALFLSSFNPVGVLKGTLKLKGGNVVFRKGLVVFQFVLSIVLIIGTIVVSKQVNYIRTRNLGYDRTNLVYIPQEGELNTKYQLFKQQASAIPGIQSISRMEQTPVNITTNTWDLDWEGKPADVKPIFGYAGVGFDFARTMNVQVVQGHDFRPGFASDSIGYILNEEAIKQTGYKDPIGKPFTMWGLKATIVGVVKDFNYNTLHTPVKAQILYLAENDQNGHILLKLSAGKTKEVMTSLEKLCKQLNPEFPFTWQFADEEYNKLYSNEQLVGKLADCFAFLAIFISCLGLLGLAMFTAEQRTREIGIRKVLGASVLSVVRLLSKEFLALVVVALLIATPLAWYFMNAWLQDFAYRTDISWWIFAVAGLLAIFIALLTIGFQSVKSALANPVKALRSE